MPLHRRFELTWENSIWLHVFFWVMYFLTMLLATNFFLSFQFAFLRALVNTLPLMFLFYLNIQLVNSLLEQGRVLVYVLLTILLLLVIAYLRMEINMIFPRFPIQNKALSERMSLFGTALLTNGSLLLFGTFYQLLVNRAQSERKKQAIIQEQQAAQLQFLRAQINPHFLFNTLHNIYSLAVVGSEKTADMVLKLSNLLRYVIYESQEDLVPLQREVEHIEKFIDLFQMRSEALLHIRFEYEGLNRTVEIEPMILIPLVENCFKHCDFDSNPEAFIHLQLRVNQEGIHFFAKNSKNDLDQQKDQMGGVGLENIQRRLELKYPGRYRLELQNEAQTFTVVCTINQLNQDPWKNSARSLSTTNTWR